MKELNNRISWSKAVAGVCLITGIFSGTAFAQTTKESKKASTKDTESEIVMSVEELESLLSKIAEKRRQTNLSKQGDLLYKSPTAYVNPTWTQQSTDMALLNQKMDLLLQLYRLNPVQPGQTVVASPNALTTSPATPNPAAVNNLAATGKKSPEGRNILNSTAIYFGNNSIKLNQQDQTSILKFASELQANQNQAIVVLRGFASKTGSAFYNNQLSFNRAEAIKKVLMSAGVRADQIMIMYHGADASTPDHLARRVDINLEQL